MSSQDNNQVYSQQGEPIQEGDHVYTKIRGGRHEGDVSTFDSLAVWKCLQSHSNAQVETIVTTKEAAREYGVKHPPKVLFTDQKGKGVEHNPGTLDIVEK